MSAPRREVGRRGAIVRVSSNTEAASTVPSLSIDALFAPAGRESCTAARF